MITQLQNHLDHPNMNRAIDGGKLTRKEILSAWWLRGARQSNGGKAHFVNAAILAGRLV